MVDDTIRDAPQARGKGLVWTLLILGALTALSTGLGALSTGAIDPVSQARTEGIPPAQRDALIKAATDLAHTWQPWTLATQIPYALATAVMAALALAVVLSDSERTRRFLMIAAIGAAVARVAVGLVGYQLIVDAIDMVGKAIQHTGPPVGNEAQMAKGMDLLTDFASTMSMLTTVVVTLFWLIAGVLVGPNKAPDPAAEPAP